MPFLCTTCPTEVAKDAGAQVQQFSGSPKNQNLSLALSAMQTQSGMVLFLSGRVADGAVVIDTWADDVTDITNDAAAVACLGIIPYEARDSTSEQTDPQEVWTASPTQAVILAARACLHRPQGSAASDDADMRRVQDPASYLPGHLQEAEWIIETSSNNPRRTRKVKVNLQNVSQSQ